MIRRIRRLLQRRDRRELLNRILSQLRREARTAATLGGSRPARAAIRPAFAAFETRIGWRGYAVAQIAAEADLLRRQAGMLTAGDADAQRLFCDELIAASNGAALKFRPAKMQSYADVAARVAAVRTFASYAAGAPFFGGDPFAVTSLVMQHYADDRAVLLADAEMLLDRGAKTAAVPLIRRALRIQAVCSTGQQMLARAVDGVDYDLSDKFCPMPFTHLSTSFAGDAFSCCCPAWLPYKTGNVLDAGSAEAVWNSEQAIEIRRSIHDGDFRYCSRTLCSYIAARKLPKKSEITDPVLRTYIDERTVVVRESPAMVQMNHDQSCNLACPSCRTSIITATPKEQRGYLEAADRVLLPLLRRVDGMTYISGGGEAFASTHYRRILGQLTRRDYPGLYIYLITNGQLLDARRWAEFPHLPEMIGTLAVSIDAATAGTYEHVRRPGKWPVLLKNLELMAAMRAAGKLRRFQINFVVQAENFREIPEFIALGDRLGVDGFWLQRLTNYGSYAEPAFAKNDVTSPEHPDHGELLTILRQPIMSDPRIDMTMLMPLLPEVVAGDTVLPLLRMRRRPELFAIDTAPIAEA